MKERIIKGEIQILVLFGEIVTIATITNDHKLNVSFEQWITPASIRKSKIYPQHPIGRDDFNFSSWILLASSQIAPVTERNTLDFNGHDVGGLLYPPRALTM